MSNHLAIATVTATLRQRLHDAVTRDVGGVSVEMMPLHDTRLKDTQAMLNVCLYHLSPNVAWANEELPVRRENGSVAHRPRLALRLHYIVTAFGRSSQTDPEAHRVLGSAIRTLHERPILTRSEITAVVQSHSLLAGSDLADQIEPVRISPQILSLEEVSKLWSVFFQTPYRISMTYEASVVLIDAGPEPQPSLPVQARNLYVQTLRSPALEGVESASGRFAPIGPAGAVVLRGTNLRGAPTRVRIGTIEVEPDADDVRDDRIELTLPPTLRAGIQGVQIVHPLMMGTPETEHVGVTSNSVPFVLRPSILRNAADTAWEITVDVMGGTGAEPRDGEITVRVEPEVERRQRVSLLLNETGSASSGTARAFSLEARSRAEDAAETTDTVEFPFADLPAGTYVARVQVDGAESAPLPDVSGQYAEPGVVVP